MPSLGLAPSFFRRYPDLPREVQKKVPALIERFKQSTLAGIHLERPQTAIDARARTVRVDKFWRGIVMAPVSGELYVLFEVLQHDKAYEWCARHSFVTNAATNAIEVIDRAAVQAVEESLTTVSSGGGPAGNGAGGRSTGPGLFDGCTDGVLLSLGISAEHLPLVREIETLSDLSRLTAVWAPSQSDALVMLAAGYSQREAAEELGISVGGRPAEPILGEDAALLASPTVYFPRDQGELLEALRRPLELWRIFLHPSQRRIAYRPVFNGPARVTGGAGTGKTVVAVHRAHYLAGRLPAGPDCPILLTTFGRTLADNLAANLESLAGPGGGTRVDVGTVDALAHRVVQQAEGRDPGILTDNAAINRWWHDVASGPSGWAARLSGAALRQEWEQVILAQNLRSEAAYLAAVRSGRGRRLTRPQRAAVWPAVEDFVGRLRTAGLRTFHQLAEDAAGYLQGAPAGDLYAHVIVDEAQDLHPAQWRLLRAAVPPGPNDLFLVGDAHQRIYDHRVSLSRLGIDIRGRSSRLTLNYRTTEEILRWCVGLLRGVAIDDLDAGTDTLAGYRSAYRGSVPPRLAGHPTRDAELADLVRVVSGWIQSGTDPATIGVATRLRRTAQAALAALRDAGIPVHDLERSGPAGVEVGTIHRMKGLEFVAFAVVDVSAAAVPARWAVTLEADDPKAHELDLLRERCLLYVACTRAREYLNVSWSGRPSPFIAHLTGHG